MAITKFRVRFAAPQNADQSGGNSRPSDDRRLLLSSQRSSKSKTGCLDCKRRHVRCDETYPVCGHCQRRGAVCHSIPRLGKWQVELPGLSSGPYDNPLYGVSNKNQRLLQLWMERTCQIMTIDPNDNPFSFPIIEHLLESDSLLHALQSVSAGFEACYKRPNLTLCLEERHRALVSLQLKLKYPCRPSPATFLAIYMLGLTASWIERDRAVFGLEHFGGARAIIDSMIEAQLEDSNATANPTLDLIFGAYMYWDMCCSMFANPEHIMPLNTPQIYQYIQSMRNKYHPICGFSIELCYLLGNLGRYCRRVLEGWDRDFVMEATFEEQLIQYTGPEGNPLLSATNDCFRNHGLILLYRICGIPRKPEHSFSAPDDDNDDSDSAVAVFSGAEETSDVDSEDIIRTLALDIISKLSEIPLSSSTMNIQEVPLLTAGSELSPADCTERKAAKTRLLSLYSRTRCPPNLWACDLLDAHWSFRDKTGSKISWLALSLQKGWRISLA